MCHPEAAADALRVALEEFSQDAGDGADADMGGVTMPEGGKMVLCMEVRERVKPHCTALHLTLTSITMSCVSLRMADIY